ncbi:winged helix-turn-helix domain-containing protein [Thermoproteota archaeon]
MPVKGKMSEWEREDNRTQLFKLLLEKSYRYNELFRASGFSSKSTLNNHLLDLVESGVVEKAIENGKMVYRIGSNEEDIVSEFKKMNYDVLLELISEFNPELGLFLKVFSWGAIQGSLWERKRRLKGLGAPSAEEVLDYARKHALDYDFTDVDIELMQSDSYRDTMLWVLQFFRLEGLMELLD